MDRNSNITLNNWFNERHSADEKRELFLCLDSAMKYVHEKGYCVKTFNPNEIELINKSINLIKFNTLLIMPDDEIMKSKLKKEDIFNSSVLQVGLYSGSLKYLKPEYLKENFDDFVSFLPEIDVGYYRGVVQNDAAVYFNEFEAERERREQLSLSNQVNDSKINAGENSIFNHNMNEKNNKQIYRGLKDKNAAFLNLLIYPIIFSIITILTTLIVLLFR